MKRRRVIRALGVLIIIVSLYLIWIDFQEWRTGAAGNWETFLSIFVRVGAGIGLGLMFIFLSPRKMSNFGLFSLEKVARPSSRRSFKSRLQPKSKYEYDESEVIELDSDRRSGK